ALTLYFPVRGRLVTITDNSYKILVDNLKAGGFSAYQDEDRQPVINAVRRVSGQQGVKYVMVVSSENRVYYDTFSGGESLEGDQFLDELTVQANRTKDTAVGLV